MKYKLLRLSLLSMLVMFFGGLAYAQGSSTVSDELTLSTFGVTGTTYSEVTGISATSSAVYAAQMAGGNSAIQMRSNNSNSGIVTTASGGTVKSIKVEWNSNTADARTLEVYGKSTAYSAATELYNSDTQGTSIASFTKSDGDQEITIDGSYEFIGFRSKSGAMYIDKITIVWENNSTDNREATTIYLVFASEPTGVVGETMELPTATVQTASGAIYPNATFEWSCSDTAIAAIDGSTIQLKSPGTVTITVAFSGDTYCKGSSASFKLTVTNPSYTSIAAMLQDITATRTPATYQFENLLVRYVSGSYTYVTDGKDNMLFYGRELGLTAGDIVSGSVTGQLYTYNSLPELSLSASDVTVEVVSSGNESLPTIIELNALENNINNYITIKEATYVSADNKNLTFKIGEETFVAYNQFGLDITALEADKVYDITGFGSVYNGTYQIYPVSITEVVAEEPEQYVYRDFAVQLTNADVFATDVNNFGVKVAEDGTYTAVAADDETANFTVNAARFNDAQHGWVNCTFTVPVEGAVKIELGDCQFGGQNGTITDDNGNVTDIKANATKKCWSSNAPHENVVVAYYAGVDPTTLTIVYNGYCPFIAVTKIDPSEIPSEATLTFDVANAGAEGVAPTPQKVEMGTVVTIPANTTLYKEGYTLTAWTDGTAEYAAGQEFNVTEDVTLQPVFTENTVKFADRTAETTLTWQFGEANGAGVLNAQGSKTILVTQATIGDQTIDVKMDIDATSGKINNVGRGDKWAQCNDGTILTIPAYKGTAVSFDSYSDGTGTTIGGVDATDKAATYEGTAETLDIVAKGIGYIASVTAVYPVPAADEEKFVDIKADFTNGSFFAEGESGTYGLKINEDGTFTRVAADDATANAVISGKFHSNEHGLANFSATVKVLGTVKVSMGTCAWGGDVTVTNAEGTVVATFNTNTGACYHNDKTANIVSAFYKINEPTTLTISGGAYTPYFAVEAVSPEQIPNDVKFVYDIANADAEGVAPEAETIAIGKEYTLPKNFTLYKEGYTLTGWTDGENTYAPGETITAPEADEVTLTPVFTQNEVTLADRTEEVTVKFDFQKNNGAPSVQWQNQADLIWVAQATVNGTTIDVPTRFSTAPGKFNNTNWGDWCQINEGTTFAIPSCKGATISVEAFNELSKLTIDGQSDYTSGKTISYTIAGAAETVDVVFGNEGSYYRYIQVILPVVQSQGGGESYENATAKVNWPFNDSGSLASYVAEPAGAFSTVAVNTGDLTITGVASRSADDLAAGISFIKFKPAGTTTAVQWVAKPAAGLTFTPTRISMWIQRFGTDAENGVTITAKVGEGEAVTLGNFTAPRANQGVDKDKYAKNSNWTNHVEIELTAEQQAALTSGEELTLSATVGVGSSKEGGFSDVVIEGLVNGTKADVAMYTLATVVAPEEAGSINVYPKADTYEEGSEVKLTATENFGYDFVNWTDAAGEILSEEPVFTYTMNADATLTANFVKVETYELALTVDGTNDYMVTISPAPTVVDGKNMYEAGQAVQLTANQYEGLVTFTNWSDGETNSSKLISMDGDVQITASYAQADIIAGWDFYKAGSNGRKADFYAQDNDADALNLVNTETGDVQGWLDKSTLGGGGYESFAGAAVNWRTGASNGDVGNWHWQTKVNAEAFSDINVQFQMLYNYNAYQTYLAEYSLDGETWTKFGSVSMGGTRQVGIFSEQLPVEANNQKALYIRMRADKENSSVDGAASANDGNTLAMFFITGTPKLVDDGTAPVLVSTVPEDGATGASATGKIVLTFDERVKVADGVKATLGTAELTPVVSGKTVTFEYKGLEYSTEYTFTLAANSVADLTDNFLTEPITLTFTTMVRPNVTKGTYDYVVENVDDLMAAIAAAQARSDKNVRYRIFIKNGEYTIPLSSTTKTVNGYDVPECITFINTDNVSFIGESRDGVIITNGIDKSATFAGTYGTTSKYDGIGNSDVFQLRGQGYYWQDLTVETGMDDATGRDLAIHDRGTKNIYKNVGLRGYQDTWTSNNDNGLYYFEDGYVRGRTDYMCGKGDIFWNRVELRQIAGGYAAVPSKPAKYGWIYKDCVINGEGSGVDGNYTLGRPWGSGTPIALFIDTKMNVVPSAIGWNEMSNGWPARFAEFNSTTSSGSVIDLSGRKKTFGDGHENNPVLTAEEALENSDMHRMFGDWDPTLATEQAPVPANVTLEGTTLTWDNSNYALLWAIVKNGKVIGFTTEPTYTVDDATAKYAVRAANEMGGLSEAAEATITTGIENVETAQPATDDKVYTVQGIRVDKARRGLYIVNGRKVVIK